MTRALRSTNQREYNFLVLQCTVLSLMLSSLPHCSRVCSTSILTTLIHLLFINYYFINDVSWTLALQSPVAGSLLVSRQPSDITTSVRALVREQYTINY